jgi:hypothetical protein
MPSNSMQALVSTHYLTILLTILLISPTLLGGLHRALHYSPVHARVVAAYDWDPAARQVYDHNYPKGISRRVRTHNRTFYFPD